MKSILLIVIYIGGLNFCFSQQIAESFPDGMPIDSWFKTYEKLQLKNLGKQYVITEFGVQNDSTIIQTQKIQAVIDLASQNGGGVIVIPKGVFLSGALFFKFKTALHLVKEAVLKGSDDIKDYPIMPSRMEGQNLDYFPALINAYKVDHFSISGEGTIDGNGKNSGKLLEKKK